MDNREILRQYIAANILFSDKYPYNDQASFLDNGVIDSMNIMELVIFLEENLGIKVADEEIVPEHFDSIELLSEFIENKLEVAA